LTLDLFSILRRSLDLNALFLSDCQKVSPSFPPPRRLNDWRLLLRPPASPFPSSPHYQPFHSPPPLANSYGDVPRSVPISRVRLPGDFRHPLEPLRAIEGAFSFDCFGTSQREPCAPTPPPFLFLVTSRPSFLFPLSSSTLSFSPFFRSAVLTRAFVTRHLPSPLVIRHPPSTGSQRRLTSTAVDVAALFSVAYLGKGHRGRTLIDRLDLLVSFTRFPFRPGIDTPFLSVADEGVSSSPFH